jgi:hypothetical protein
MLVQIYNSLKDAIFTIKAYEQGQQIHRPNINKSPNTKTSQPRQQKGSVRKVHVTRRILPARKRQKPDYYGIASS